MGAALLSCDVFADEIARLSPAAGGAILGVAWLEMGLHDHPPRLRAAVQAEIARLEADPAVERILLAYGRCGNGLIGVSAGRTPLVLPRAHDCISILLGGCARHEALLREEPGAYFYSPGWVRGRRVPGPDREAALRALYAERYADDPEMVEELLSADRETFAHHGCAVYVDITDDASARTYCQDCARHLGWRMRHLEGDPTLLRDLLCGPWDAARFLTVPPGQSIVAAADGSLLAGPRT